jgi:hypothetical protein
MQQMVLYCEKYFFLFEKFSALSWFIIHKHAKIIVRSTCFGHHYAHHQEIKSIMQVVTACGTWCFDLQVVGLVWRSRLFAGYRIMVPETC